MDTLRRRQRQSGKKSRIVALASRLAVEKGLDGFSLTDVARAVGISKGTLYYYYPTKSELIFDIAARHVNEITRIILEMMAEGGSESEPAALLALFFREHKANRTRMRLHLNLVHRAMNGDKALPSFEEAFRIRDKDDWAALEALYEAELDKLLKLDPAWHRFDPSKVVVK